MALEESLKEKIKKEALVERQKLKNMSLEDKIWYIWEYYKFHIAAVIGVLFVFSIIGTSIYNSTIENSLYCVIINNPNAFDMDYEVFTQEFHDYMGFGKKQEVHAESITITYGEVMSELSYASMAKISALIASGELDVMICDQENFQRYQTMDGFMDLEEVLPADLLEQLQDRICYGASEDGRQITAAIDVSGTPFAARSGIALEPALCCFISNSQNTDTALALLRYMFDM